MGEFRKETHKYDGMKSFPIFINLIQLSNNPFDNSFIEHCKSNITFSNDFFNDTTNKKFYNFVSGCI